MGHYKYVHIFYYNETKFISYLLNDIDNSTIFNPSEHLIVTPYKEVYEQLKGNNNLVYYEVKKRHRFKSAEIINYYANYCDYIFIHGLCNPRQVLFIKRNVLNRIIWRTWGVYESTFPSYPKKKLLHYIISKVFRFETKFKKRIQQFRYVGIANLVDYIDIKNKLNVERFATLNYKYDLIKEKQINKDMFIATNEGNCINVMIGHSGFSYENHFKMIQKLERFANENIKIYLPFIYGAEKYMEIVLEQIKTSKLKDKIVILKEFLPYEDWVQRCSEMDIFIIDSSFSSGLGFVFILLQLNATMYLNANGIITQVFDMKNIPYKLTSEIENMSWDDFTKPVQYTGKEDKLLTVDDCVHGWSECLKTLQ